MKPRVVIVVEARRRWWWLGGLGVNVAWNLDDNDPHLTQSIRFANGGCSINPAKYPKMGLFLHRTIMLVHYTLGAECAA